MRWVSRLLSNNNEYEEPCIPRVRIGDTVTSEELCFGEEGRLKINGISIADIQTKVVKEMTVSPIRTRGMHGSSYSFLLHHIC